MKAVIMTSAPDELLDKWLCRKKRPSLTGLVSSLEKLGADEILMTGENALNSRFSDWFERERGRFQKPVTFRFHDESHRLREIDPLMRLVRHESLEASALLVFLSDGIPADLGAFKKTLYLHPYSPVVGVRKPDHDPASGAVSIGERNRITRFSSSSERRENEWEPAGAYYFPERFLSDGIPAFVRSRTGSLPVFESFISWSVRNFKVYAHVFAARPGL